MPTPINDKDENEIEQSIDDFATSRVKFKGSEVAIGLINGLSASGDLDAEDRIRTSCRLLNTITKKGIIDRLNAKFLLESSDSTFSWVNTMNTGACVLSVVKKDEVEHYINDNWASKDLDIRLGLERCIGVASERNKKENTKYKDFKNEIYSIQNGLAQTGPYKWLQNFSERFNIFQPNDLKTIIGAKIVGIASGVRQEKNSLPTISIAKTRILKANAKVISDIIDAYADNDIKKERDNYKDTKALGESVAMLFSVFASPIAMLASPLKRALYNVRSRIDTSFNVSKKQTYAISSVTGRLAKNLDSLGAATDDYQSRLQEEMQKTESALEEKSKAQELLAAKEEKDSKLPEIDYFKNNVEEPPLIRGPLYTKPKLVRYNIPGLAQQELNHGDVHIPKHSNQYSDDLLPNRNDNSYLRYKYDGVTSLTPYSPNAVNRFYDTDNKAIDPWQDVSFEVNKDKSAKKLQKAIEDAGPHIQSGSRNSFVDKLERRNDRSNDDLHR